MTDTENPAPPAPTAGQLPASRKASGARSKRRRRRVVKAKAAPKLRRLMVQDDRLVDAKPSMPALDPLAAAQEEALHAKEGNLKLAKALEILRVGLETIVIAEEDRATGLPVTAKELRTMAVTTLDLYSAQVGQSWRKAKLSGASRAGTKGNKPVHESQMGMPPEE